jgi:hypothetical protein
LLSLVLFFAVGAIIGLARGGSFRNVSVARIRWLPLLYGALVLQVTANWPPERLDELAFAITLVSYAGVFAFAAANRRMIGMQVLAFGALLNFIVIVVNGGMPVSPAALAAIGEPDFVVRGKHIVDDGTAHLRFLSDIIAWRLGPRIVSVGDLFTLGGIALIVEELLQPVRVRAST